MKKVRSFLAVALALMMLATLAIVPASAVNPTLGSVPSSVTLYVNDPNNYYRDINITVSSYDRNCTYTAVSSNSSVVSLSNKAANSKSGLHFRLNAKNVGSATITVSVKKSGKVLSSKKISVTVKKLAMPTPGVRRASATSNKVTLAISLSNTNNMTNLVVQRSTSKSFPDNSNTKAWRVGKAVRTFNDDTVSKNKTYYYRVAAANGKFLGNWSSVLTVKTPAF